MKIILIISLICLILSWNDLYSQVITGKVYIDNGKYTELLDGATVKWLNTSIGSITDSNGYFEIESGNILNRKLLVSFLQTDADTVDIGDRNFVEIILKKSITTETIKVEEKTDEQIAFNMSYLTEIVTQKDLKKAACCDLTGAFHNSASVDVAVTDVISDSKELKLLGTEGSFTQTLIDGIPLITNVSSSYGLSMIPGSLIKNIFVSKGANSVVQGYESTSGLVNVILKDREASENLFLNAFVNDHFEKQLDGNIGYKIKDWNMLLSLHTLQKANKTDDNGDSFLDMPLITRYGFFNRWKYKSWEEKGINLNFIVRYTDEKRIGGQTNFNEDTDIGSNTIYGQTIKTKNLDIYGKSKYKFNDDNILYAYLSYNNLNENSYYGLTKYSVLQNLFYMHLMYEGFWDIFNEFRIGIDYRYENVHQDISFVQNPYNKTYQGNYRQLQSVPGIFAENSFNLLGLKLIMMPGIRYDYHNTYGSFITPRMLIKYEPTEGTVFRGVIGSGTKVNNIFAENSNIFGSAKNIIIIDTEPVKSLNAGVTLSKIFEFSHSIVSKFEIEYFRTVFTNQIIPDYTTIPGSVIFTNLNNSSASNSFQIETALDLFEQLRLKFTYNYLDAYYYKDGIRKEIPFTIKNKILAELSYESIQRDWLFSTTLQYNGRQPLPETNFNPPQYRLSDESSPYFMWNAQITKSLGNFEIYTGIENILNFKQQNPIIESDNPFGEYFDSSIIWGPTRGRQFYIGLRFKMI